MMKEKKDVIRCDKTVLGEDLYFGASLSGTKYIEFQIGKSGTPDYKSFVLTEWELRDLIDFLQAMKIKISSVKAKRKPSIRRMRT